MVVDKDYAAGVKLLKQLHTRMKEEGEQRTLLFLDDRAYQEVLSFLKKHTTTFIHLGLKDAGVENFCAYGGIVCLRKKT